MFVRHSSGRVVALACIVLQASLTLAADLTPPERADCKTVDLDEPFEAFAVGGAGRYFVFHLKRAQKIALLDVNAAAIVKTIDAPAADILMTAGLEKLVVATPSKNLLHRYNLATLTREKTTQYTGPFPSRLLLGSASTGPLILWAQKGPVSLFDLETLKRSSIQGEALSGDAQYGFGLTVSSDGQTACGWAQQISGQRFQVMRLANGAASLQDTPGAFSDAGRWLRPNSDGTLLFQNGATIYPADLQPIKPDQFQGDVLSPSEDRRFFLALDSDQTSKKRGKKNAQAWICTTGGLEKLVCVRDIGDVLVGLVGSEHGQFRALPRVWYMPAANVLVSLPAGEKTVLLIGANLKKLMEEREDDYLHVVSAPPRNAWVGRPYSYQLQVMSSRGKVRYKVEEGPSELKVSGDGNVTWTPKTRPTGGIEKVVIVARDPEGLESFHSFEVAVDRPPKHVIPPKGRAGKPQRASTAPSGGPAKVDGERLEIPKGNFVLVPGRDPRTTLLLQGARLTILGAGGLSVVKSFEFKHPYERVGERADYWVGVRKNPFAVEIIDKQSLAVSKSVKFSAQEIQDLALHPRQSVSYVAFKVGPSAPHFKFIVFQESKGEARESEEFIGSYLAVDPGGRFLMSGYRDIYERGSRLLFNPDRIDLVPDYGNIDFLIRYDLNRAGMPQVAAVKKQAGGNGAGIRLSPDGKRVSYLSASALPHFLATWRPGTSTILRRSR